MPSSPKANILLVDDRPENLLTLEAVLSDLGQNLVKAGSGREALKHLLAADYAVVLLDVQMPEMDGFQTAALIRSRPKSRHTPLIFLTAINKSEAAVFQGYSMGAVDYVFKPFVPEILRSKVAAFVALSQQQEELQAEIAQRKQAEEDVRKLNQDLERRVSERTAELAAANRTLEAEIAERRVLEAALQQRAAELTEADRRKDEFLAMLAHELRNPLAPIQNAAQVLGMSEPDTTVLQRQRSIIQRQVQHLARLVDDLMDVSRITRGIIDLRKERIELQSMVERAVEAALPLIQKKKHELKLSLPAEPLPVEADPVRLQQIVVNLLNNATKYTEPDGTIWLTAEREQEWAVLRVRDSGVGIAPALLPHIFDLFTQAEQSLDRSQGGLGIGLTMVDRLVRLHGGNIVARSDGPGQGSEFVVRLPLGPTTGSRELGTGPATTPAALVAPVALPDLDPCPELLPPSALAPVLDPRSPGLRVLVVDDNVDAAETLAHLLEFWGCEVRVAHDGPSAITTAMAYEPTVVLLDIGLPGMDGYQVARQLRQQEGLKSALLVGVTGYGQEDDRSQSREAGLDHHLTKPVAPDTLRRLIAELLLERAPAG